MNNITVQSLEAYCFDSSAQHFHIVLVTDSNHYYYTNPGFTELDNEEGFLDTTVFEVGEMGEVYYKALKEAKEATFLTAGHLSPLEVLPFLGN